MVLLKSSPFSLVQPDYGLLFWTALIFCILWLILGKFAFGPITNALRDREDGIRDALDAAEKAKAEMANLTAENERILAEAREERTLILAEAKEMKASILDEARQKAKEEAKKIAAQSMEEIAVQKRTAIAEVKNLIGSETVNITEKLLSRELDTGDKHSAYILQEMQKLNLN